MGGGVGQLLCFRCLTMLSALPTTTGLIYHQRQAGMERSDMAACFILQGGPKKVGRRLMTIILLNLNRLIFFSLEDSLVS